MKTITGVLIASFVFGGILGVKAQNEKQRAYIAKHSDINAVEKLQVQFDKRFQENYSKALNMARQKGWEITIKHPDGSFSQLKGVTPDGNPLYYTTSNQGSAKTSRVNRINPGGSAGLNLDGTGMTVGVWDAGKPRLDHVDLVGRISNGDASISGYHEHSTHVMGTVIGSGANRAQARGMAYNAKAIWADWTNDFTEMANAVKSKSLILSNHSYGLTASSVPKNWFGAYIQASKDLDDLLFASPYYQAVYAAGNDRDDYLKYNATKQGYDLLSDACTAKNVIVVAAVEEVLNYTSASNVIMSRFSNWGPTDDNRIKPDISDKGVQVLSTVETSPTAYAYLDGTSMASPGVTGALLLIQQQFLYFS